MQKLIYARLYIITSLSFISTTLFSQETSLLMLYLPEESLYNKYELQSSMNVKQMLLFNKQSVILVINEKPEGSGFYTLNDDMLDFTIEENDARKVYKGQVFHDSLVLSITTYKDNNITDEKLNRTYILKSHDPIKPNRINMPNKHEIVIEEYEIEEEKADQIYQIVEQPASPKGGYPAFYQFISERLIYPAVAIQLGVEGTVYVQFIVGKDGALSDIMAIRGIGAGCDEEAVRVIKESPNWHPPMQRGKPVIQRIVLPIKFQLQKPEKKKDKKKGN